MNHLRPLFYLFSSGCHFLAYRRWMLPGGVLERPNHRSRQLKVTNFKIFSQNLYIRRNLINFSTLSLTFFTAFLFHYRRVIFENSELLRGFQFGIKSSNLAPSNRFIGKRRLKMKFFEVKSPAKRSLSCPKFGH